MEICAEVQKCNMDNKFFNEQRDKYGKGGANNANQKAGSSNNTGAGN
jgi:hypothetical protein